ncbi:Transposase [compost metagenome]
MADRTRKYQHHPIAFKRQIVEASLVPGISVAALALKHGINANQVWAWRKLYNEGRLLDHAAPLLQVDVIESQPDFPTVATCAGSLEIVIGAARLSVTGVVDLVMLKTAIAALRA